MEISYTATAKEVGTALGLYPDTVKRWARSGKLPAHCFTRIGTKTIRFCLPAVLDWAADPTDLEAQARAAAAIQESRLSNQPKKRGRKSV